jgi:Ran GTPase-activating protein (RanGAP) involved in mRNA processing and transport
MYSKKQNLIAYILFLSCLLASCSGNLMQPADLDPSTIDPSPTPPISVVENGPEKKESDLAMKGYRLATRVEPTIVQTNTSNDKLPSTPKELESTNSAIILWKQDYLGNLPRPIAKELSTASGRKKVDKQESDLASKVAGGLSKNMEELNLSVYQIDDQVALQLAGYLSEMSGLRKLDISKNFLNINSVLSLLQGLSKGMEELDLSNNQIDDQVALGIAACLSEMSKLRKLSISGNRLGIKGVLSLLQSLPSSIEELDLSDNQIDLSKCQINDAVSLELTEYLSAMPNLKKLNISKNRLGKSAVNLLQGLSKGMEELDLSNNQIDLSDNRDDDKIELEVVTGSLKMSGLKELKIGSNRLGSNFFIALLEGLPASIERLALQQIGIEAGQSSKKNEAWTRAAAMYLQNLKNLTNLKQFSLAGNYLGRGFAQIVIQNLPGSIKEVNLNSTQVNEESVQAVEAYVEELDFNQSVRIGISMCPLRDILSVAGFFG